MLMSHRISVPLNKKFFSHTCDYFYVLFIVHYFLNYTSLNSETTFENLMEKNRIRAGEMTQWIKGN